MKVLFILLLLFGLSFAQTQIDVGAVTGAIPTQLLANYTLISLSNPANATGVIDSILFFIDANRTDQPIQFGSFYLDGSNYICRDSCSLLLTGTVNTYVTMTGFTPFNINEGDYIGYYSATITNRRTTDNSGSGVLYKLGDQFGATTTYTSIANQSCGLLGFGVTPTPPTPATTTTRKRNFGGWATSGGWLK